MSGEGRRRGRPPGSGLPPEKRRRQRSIRITDDRWAKLQDLGMAWLDQAIDDAAAAKGTPLSNQAPQNLSRSPLRRDKS